MSDKEKKPKRKRNLTKRLFEELAEVRKENAAILKTLKEARKKSGGLFDGLFGTEEEEE